MQTLRNKLMAGGAVLILAAVGSLMNRQAAHAAGAPVTIESPIPLPISGAMTAKQGGSWNVGITGTPGVNISNSPTVNLASGTTILARSLDDPGRIPYQSTVDMTGKCSGARCDFSFVSVPSGHRRVIQHIGGAVSLTGTPLEISVGVTAAPGAFVSSFLAPVTAGIASTVFDQPLLFYLDQLQSVVISIDAVGNEVMFFAGGAAQTVTLTGYELDCGVAPCAPIAQ